MLKYKVVNVIRLVLVFILLYSFWSCTRYLCVTYVKSTLEINSDSIYIMYTGYYNIANKVKYECLHNSKAGVSKEIIGNVLYRDSFDITYINRSSSYILVPFEKYSFIESWNPMSEYLALYYEISGQDDELKYFLSQSHYYLIKPDSLYRFSGVEEGIPISLPCKIALKKKKLVVNKYRLKIEIIDKVLSNLRFFFDNIDEVCDYRDSILDVDKYNIDFIRTYVCKYNIRYMTLHNAHPVQEPMDNIYSYYEITENYYFFKHCHDIASVVISIHLKGTIKRKIMK